MICGFDFLVLTFAGEQAGVGEIAVAETAVEALGMESGCCPMILVVLLDERLRRDQEFPEGLLMLLEWSCLWMFFCLLALLDRPLRFLDARFHRRP